MRREELYLVRQGLPSLSLLTYTTSVILVSVDEKHDNKLLLELIDIPAFFYSDNIAPSAAAAAMPRRLFLPFLRRTLPRMHCIIESPP